MNYISLKKAEQYLNIKKGKQYSKSFLISQIDKGNLKAVKVANEWLMSKEDLNAFISQGKEIQGRVNVIRLFGWELGVIVGVYLKKTQNILWPFKTYWQETMALALLVVMIGSSIFFFQSSIPSIAATFTWVQSSWSGGATTTVADHSTDQSDWTYYASSTWGISTGTDLTLVVTSTASSTQTLDADFDAGTFDNTATSGDSVYAQKPLGFICSDTIDCISGNCVDGVCCDTACGTCKRCDSPGSVGTCINVDESEDDYGCTGGGNWCLSGTCYSCDWTDHTSYGNGWWPAYGLVRCQPSSSHTAWRYSYSEPSSPTQSLYAGAAGCCGPGWKSKCTCTAQ